MSADGSTYTVYKMDISYFSGKLEAYLRYKGIAYEAVEADARALAMIQRKTGIQKVPAVLTPDGQWLFDTTPSIAWLEQAHPQRPVIPADPALRFIALLLEDYADEWLWRPAMWWRWEPPVSRRALGLNIAHHVNPKGIPKWAMARYFAWRQRRTWLWGDGMDAQNSAAVRDLYLQELDFLQPLLRDQDYVLGSQPSIADFGYFASMFRHFGNDPDPAEVMRRRAPAVYAWLARMWQADAASSASPDWQLPSGPHWQPLWARVVGDYLPYLRDNARAYGERRKRFDFCGASLDFRGTVTHHYRAWCRQVLQREYAALDSTARTRVDAVVAPAGELAGLLGGDVVETGMDAQFQLPRPPGNFRPSLAVALFGQARN